MSSGYEERIRRLEARLQPALDELRQLSNQIAGLQQQQFALGPGFADGGGDGGGGGIFYADGLVIAALGSITSVTLRESWTGDPVTAPTVWNSMPDATDGSKRQLLGKNPDGTYTVINQSCSNHP